MELLEKAKKFAIKAHINQVRKSEPEKPMIVHPINVANILKEFNFDDNVIAAGFLHDVIEDTNIDEKDIINNFGEDIAALVLSASEPDKSLSWEERKMHTILNTKNLNIRNKAIICADKISNLEDLKIKFEKNGKVNFDSFKRGFDSQKWYNEEVYKSLIYNEDALNPMFVRLKKLIDYIYNNQKNEYSKNTIFKNFINEYNDLIKIFYKKQELIKLKSIFNNKIMLNKSVIDILFDTDNINSNEYLNFIEKNNCINEDKVILIIYKETFVALFSDYKSHLFLEPKNLLNEKTIKDFSLKINKIEKENEFTNIEDIKEKINYMSNLILDDIKEKCLLEIIQKIKQNS